MSSIDQQDQILRVVGVGYLRRIVESRTPSGAPFIACDIFALAAKPGSRAQRRFDVIVLGQVGQTLIRQCQPALKAGQEVLLYFCLRDVQPHTFTYTKGKNAGKTGICLKSFLVRVYWIKIDGEYFYEAEQEETEDAEDSDDVTGLEDSEDFW